MSNDELADLQVDVPDDPDDTTDELPSTELVARAVVTATDWTTETIISQLKRGNIQLSPRFQRREAWDRVRKSRFIESLVLGLPIPQIVLAEDKRRRGAFLVLDGKQRLLTLLQFAATGAEAAEAATEPNNHFRQLKLRSLELRQDLHGKSLEDIEDDARFREEVDAFANQTIRTVVVRSWPDEDFLNLVFLRLNTGSVPLNPQELRQALHPGPATDYLDDASVSPGIQNALRLSAPDFRMRDVELLLRFLAVNTQLRSYRGDLRRALDSTLDHLNSVWTTHDQSIRSVVEKCDAAAVAVRSVFGPYAFLRWNGKDFDRRFNRAVFDATTYFAKFSVVRQASEDHREEIVDAFKDLCIEDRQFYESISTSTKTIEATAYRINRWGEKLQAVIEGDLDDPLPSVKVIDRRIEADGQILL